MVGIGNPVLFGTSVLLLILLGNNTGPLWLELIPVFFYCLFSFVPAIIGIIFALLELITKRPLKMAVIGFF